MRMKICVDAREFTGRGKTGIARYLENLLIPLGSRGDLEFTLLAHDRRFLPAALQAPPFGFVSLAEAPTLLVDQFAMPGAASREKVDVFFSPYYKIPLYGAFKRIITVHDIMFVRLPTVPLIKKFISGLQLRLSIVRTDLILADSEFTKNDVSSLLPAAEKKLRVLYPSLEPEWLKQPDPYAAAEARKHFAGGKPFFLYVGNFKPHKNVSLLVRAFAGLKAEGKAGEHRLVLAGGDDRNLAHIEVLIEQSGCMDSILIHRDVSDADLRSLYASADWFITASSYEGFGYPVLEAMASGCPVICHPCTSIPEIAGDAALNMLVLDISDISRVMMKAMAMSGVEKDALVRKARARATRFCSTSSSHLFADMLLSLSPPRT